MKASHPGWIDIPNNRITFFSVQSFFSEALFLLNNPAAISCVDNTTRETLLFALLSPKELRSFSREKRSELSKRGAQHPLLPWQKDIEATEMNILNAGIRFDFEVAGVWQKLTQEEINREQIWVYLVRN